MSLRRLQVRSQRVSCRRVIAFPWPTGGRPRSLQMNRTPENFAKALIDTFPGWAHHTNLVVAACRILIERDVDLKIVEPGGPSEVVWDAEKEDGTKQTTVSLPRPGSDAEATSKIRMWDFLHEVGHILDRKLEEGISSSLRLEREAKAWQLGLAFALTTDAEIEQDIEAFEARREWGLDTYRLAAAFDQC